MSIASSFTLSFMNKLGLVYIGLCHQVELNPEYKIYLQGYDGDPISDKLTCGAISTYGVLTRAIKIRDQIRVFPILRHINTDTIVAARGTVSTTRFVFLGVEPRTAGNLTERCNLSNKIFHWLTEGGSDIEESRNINEVPAIQIFPNPFSSGSNLYIQLNCNSSSPVKLNIFDIVSRNICKTYLFDMENNTSNFLQLSGLNLTPGYYFIIVQTGNRKFNVPFVVVE